MELKKLGYQRRMDDLGRVVIPKEARRVAKLKEDDCFDVFVTESDDILLRKQNKEEEIAIPKDLYSNIMDTLHHCMDFNLFGYHEDDSLHTKDCKEFCIKTYEKTKEFDRNGDK